MQFLGRVQSGVLKIVNKLDYTNFITKLDGNVLVEIKKPVKQRSNRQGNYYWGVVIDTLSKELGYFPDEMHQELKYKFLRTENNGIGKTRSTSDLSTVEMENYLENIRRWASIDLHIFIPEPHENLPTY